ncbi:MAG: hypothetical protein ACSHX7_05200 [Luteolibacter sp.]
MTAVEFLVSNTATFQPKVNIADTTLIVAAKAIRETTIVAATIATDPAPLPAPASGAEDFFYD